MTGTPALALLPILGFALFYLFLVGRGAGSTRGFRLNFVLASIAWGAYVTLTSELLSLAQGLTALWLVLTWLAPVGLLGYFVLRSTVLPLSWARVREVFAELGTFEKALLGGTALICVVLLGIAFGSPPNNADSAIYHMARVVHWAQDASLRPYPAIIGHQLTKPIWAETAILHLRVLWGDDRPANLIQWFSMVGSLAVISGIVSLLRGNRLAQILAVAYSVSIPMGVLQATSTQNDYVAGFWAVCLAYLVVLSMRRGLTGWELAALAACVGLGALTKGTSFVYSPPLVVWFLGHELLARGWRKAITAALAIAAVAGALNLGFWSRNIQVYGGPYGTAEWLQGRLWIRFLPAALAPVETEVSDLSLRPTPTDTTAPANVEPPLDAGQPGLQPGGYLIRLARTAGRNLTLPTGFLSRPVLAVVESIPGVFGRAYADQLRATSWNDEDFAGNPIHLLFVPLSLMALVVFRRKPGANLILAYAGVIILTYLLIPIVIGHGPTRWGIRYQLSFFLLWGPVVGSAFGLTARERLLQAASAFFLILAIPWVLLNRTRPLVGMPPLRTAVESILVEDPATILLPHNPRLRDDYLLSAEAILESGCTQIGLRADAEFLEYPLWWLLGAPQNGIRIESLETASYFAPYVDPTFQACAVVCANCEEEAVLRGLPLYGSYDSIKLYMDR